MSLNSIARIVEKVKIKEVEKARLKKLEILKLNDYIDNADIKEIDKEIDKLKGSLSAKRLKSPEDLNSIFDTFDLNYEKIEYTKFEYLYEFFITKSEITMIAAPPGSGKSLISVALANIFLLERSVDTVVYFDADNGSATIKERHVHQLKKTWSKKFRYFHESSAEISQMWQIVKQMQKTNLTNFIIFFDSIKNFMGGKNRDKNQDVSSLMEVLQSLRAKGATIIFLHHTNKPQKDLAELVYAGSSAFQESTGNAYILHKNDFTNAFLFKNFKARTGKLDNVAFKYHENHTIEQINFLDASETQETVAMNKEIIYFIEKQSSKPFYQQIMLHLKRQGYSHNKANSVIQNGKERYWVEQKLTQNNKSIYSLLKENQNVQNN